MKIEVIDVVGNEIRFGGVLVAILIDPGQPSSRDRFADLLRSNFNFTELLSSTSGELEDQIEGIRGDMQQLTKALDLLKEKAQ